jgi:tyrosinase
MTMASSPAEMVGATDQPVTLAANRTTADLAVRQPTGPAKQALAATAKRPHAYLNLENITSSGVPASYAVYLNLPDKADPKQNDHLLAGLLPAFGVAEASRADKHSAGSGLHHALNVTKVIEELEKRGQWDPQKLRVTFIPRDAGTDPVPVKVGRVSLYYKDP